MQWKRLFKNKVGLIGSVVILTTIMVALLAPFIATHDPLKTDLSLQFAPPSKELLLGADEYGRDIFSRLVYGARYSLYIGTLSIMIASFFGLIIGSIAGYYGRWTDEIIMRIADAVMALPGILLCIGIVAVMGPNIYNVVFALGFVYIPRFARIIRGSVLSLKKQEFVEASIAMGNSDIIVLWRHVLPNCMAPLIVMAATSLAYVVLAEAMLSFLGLGTPPPAPSWGNMLSEAREYMLQNPWMTVYPGMAISVLVLGVNLLGDALRDVLDPRLR